MTKIVDLTRVEVEHLLSERDGGLGLVKVRVMADGLVLIGAVEPEAARQLATDLMNVAARAEYEQDLWRGCRKADVPEDVVGMVLTTVRFGESDRMAGEGGAA